MAMNRLVEELAPESDCEVVSNKIVNVAFEGLMCLNVKQKPYIYSADPFNT